MRPFSIFTGTNSIPRSEKGVANGVATLDGTGKIPSDQIPLEFTSYKGTWNASTNTPTLADGAGNTGDFYKVSVSGTQDLGSGSITFNAGDWVFYNGSVWEKVDNSEPLYTAGAVVYASSTGILKEDTTRFKYDETLRTLLMGGEGNNSVGASGTLDSGIFVGGVNTITTSDTTVILGGRGNSITGSSRACILSSVSNTITGASYGLCHGFVNTVSAVRAISLGGSLNVSSGDESVTLGGNSNVAAGINSYAMGFRAKSNHDGTFVFTDDQNADFASTAAQQFLLRFAGGVGIGTASPNSQFHVGGSFSTKRLALAVSGNSDDEVIIGVTDTGSPRTVTIQSADIVAGRIFIIKDESGGAGTNNITIATQDVETIDGAGSATISTNYGSVRLYSDETNLFTF
jgi:hypothetical protein